VPNHSRWHESLNARYSLKRSSSLFLEGEQHLVCGMTFPSSVPVPLFLPHPRLSSSLMGAFFKPSPPFRVLLFGLPAPPFLMVLSVRLLADVLRFHFRFFWHRPEIVSGMVSPAVFFSAAAWWRWNRFAPATPFVAPGFFIRLPALSGTHG